MSKFFFFVLLSLSLTLHGQSPVFHKDSRYTGEAKLFLDTKYQQVDSAQAAYFVYVYIHKGVDVWSKKAWWRKLNCQVNAAVRIEVEGKNNGPEPLSAMLTWYKKNPNKPRVVETFIDGRNARELLIYDSNGKLAERYDYSKSWEQRPWGFYYEKIVHDQIERAGYEYYDTTQQRWVAICTQGCYVTKDIR